MSELLSYELVGDVAVVTMDDGKVNALSPQMIEDLGAALDRAEKEAKAVLLTGRPGKFCAGFDLKILMGGGEPSKALFLAGGELFLRLYGHPQPVVIAATGHAIAGGVLLLACGDLRIGVQGDFKLGLNEVAIGVPLPVFAHELARERLDPRFLVRATVLGTLFAPDEAKEVGWLDEVVEPDALKERALAAATKLAGLAPKPFAMSKKSMRGAFIERIGKESPANLVAILDDLDMG